MPVSAQAKTLKSILSQLPQVAAVGKITIADNIIRSVVLDTDSIGTVTLQQLAVDDAARLFDFYLHGLGEKSRRLFAPYPLFHTTPQSIEELARRITDWKKEDDWTLLTMVKDGQIIGVGLLKRFWTESVTSGIAVRDSFMKKGLGYVLQTVVVAQARLLKLKRFHIKVLSDNEASVRLHEKCGFRKTRVLPGMYEDQLRYLNECDKADGRKVIDRKIVEMVIDLEPNPNE